MPWAISVGVVMPVDVAALMNGNDALAVINAVNEHAVAAAIDGITERIDL